MNASASALLAATFALLGGAAAQRAAQPAEPSTPGPRLHAAFAGSEARGGAPAVQWLCEQFLPQLDCWPEGLDARGPFALQLDADGLTIRATGTEVPADAVALGTCTFTGEGAPLLWRCGTDGCEQWYVPAAFALPPRWLGLLHAIEGDVLQTPRTLSVAVAAGHLAGGLVEGDPRATALRLGAVQCGELTWLAWRKGDELRVRGRSDGGLMLPLALLALAVADGAGQPSSLALRAFAARDDDRAEATRQLGRDDREVDVPTLRSLLFAEDRVRLTAIDALARLGATDELPAIVAAADDAHPWATLAAEDALRELWPLASTETQQQVRGAAQRCESMDVRRLVLETLAERAAPLPAPTPADPGGRGRLLLALFCTAVGLLGLWTRERVRPRPAPTS